MTRLRLLCTANTRWGSCLLTSSLWPTSVIAACGRDTTASVSSSGEGKSSAAVQGKVNSRTREAISVSGFALQWGERSRENREHQTAAEVSLSDESKLCRYSSLREDQQGGAGPGPEQVPTRSTTSDDEECV